MFDGPYFNWNQNRIKTIVDHYGHNFFFNKKILDLGCGHGDISGVLHRLGADVTAVDARAEHLKILAKKYNGVKTVQADLDRPWPFSGRKFDLILDLGLLCHLHNPEDHLKMICSSADFLVLETAVLDSENPNACIIRPDNKNIYDGSFNGFSAQISATNIERILSICGMTYKRLNSTKLNSAPYLYDWTSYNSNSYDLNKRRIWFCTRRDVVSNINLLSNVPEIRGTPQILDSKIHASQQPLSIIGINSNPLVITSPLLPILPTPPPPPQFNIQIPVAPVHTTNNTVIPASKIRLFYYFYDETQAVMKSESNFCLLKHLENKYYDTIVVDADHIITFQTLFEKINLLTGKNDINVVCNTNIFFDNTISLATHVKGDEIYALSRWDWTNSGGANFSNNNSNQDAWIIRGPVRNMNANFPIGKPGSDNRIAFEFQAAGYKVINPSKSIKAYRINNPLIAKYSESDRINGQYLHVDPISF